MTEQPAPTGAWRSATVAHIDHPISHGVRLRLDVPNRIDHLPGQHYVIRLTAEDGYVAQRSYSVASPPSDPQLEFYIERLDDGEVSTFLADEVRVGDELEVRGPIGGWFVWRGDVPIVGIGGGSGVVPFIAMLRNAVATGTSELLRLAVSARTLADLPYADELADAGVLIALSRERYLARDAARLTSDELARLPGGTSPTYFVCGSPAFSQGIVDQLVGDGVPADMIRVESFGPSG